MEGKKEKNYTHKNGIVIKSKRNAPEYLFFSENSNLMHFSKFKFTHDKWKWKRNEKSGTRINNI